MARSEESSPDGPNEPKKPHAIWPGLVILGVLIGLAGLSGQINVFGVLVFSALFFPPTAGAMLAAHIASHQHDAEKALSTARPLSVLFTAAIFAIIAGGVLIVDNRLTTEAVGCLVAIGTTIGVAAAPFAGSYAMYRQARRSGKTHAEAQLISRWDADRFK